MFRLSRLVVVAVLAAFVRPSWTENCIGSAVPDPEDCHGYFLILGGVKFQQYCAPGMKFDKDKGECVVGKCPPCNCEDPNPGTEAPTPSEPDPETDPSTTTTTMSPSREDCNNIPNGSFFAHTEHCRLYWVCRDGEPVLLHCQKGMWFDAENYVCNFPHLVDCPANID